MINIALKGSHIHFFKNSYLNNYLFQLLIMDFFNHLRQQSFCCNVLINFANYIVTILTMWIVFLVLTSLLIIDELLYSLVICSSCVLISSAQVVFDHVCCCSTFPTAHISHAVTASINTSVLHVCIVWAEGSIKE